MRITTKALFNILSKNDQKELKDILLKASKDEKETKKSSSGVLVDVNLKQKNIKEFINTLLKELSFKNVTKESINLKIEQSDLPKVVKGTQKEITELLNVIKSEKSLKSFIPKLQKLLVDIKTLNPPTLKQGLSNSGVLFESKLANDSKSIMPEVIKESLNSVKSNIKEQLPNLQDKLKLLDKLLKVDDTKELKDSLKSGIKVLETFIPKKQINKIEIFVNQKESISPKSVKEFLLHVKENLQKEVVTKSQILKDIDKIQDTKIATKEFVKDIKTLVNELKNEIPKPLKSVVEVVAKLENLQKDVKLIQESIKNDFLKSNEIKKDTKLPKELEKEILRVASEVKKVFSDTKEIKVNLPKDFQIQTKEIINLPQPVVQMPVAALKFVEQNLSVKIQRIVNILKSELLVSNPKESLHVETFKQALKLEKTLKEQIVTKKLVPNQKLHVTSFVKDEIATDMKSTLLSLKKEISSNSSISKDVSLRVDRVLNHIEYFQLISLSSNSFSTYLPFIWEGLEGGNISFKKLKKRRYFCEINLSLKEYKEIDLVLMLFDDIHLNIALFAESKEFIGLAKEHLSELKKGLNGLGLIVSSIDFFNEKRAKKSLSKDNFFSDDVLDLQV